MLKKTVVCKPTNITLSHDELIFTHINTIQMDLYNMVLLSAKQV